MEWTLRPVHYRFIFLGKKLFSVAAPMHVLEAAFTELGDDPDRTPLPLAPGDGAAGAYIRSHPVAHDLPRLAMHDGLMRFVPSHYDRALLTIRGSFADYSARFNAKQRGKYKRYVKKIAELTPGGECFRLYSKPEEILEWHRLASEVARDSYQAKLFERALPSGPEFERKLVELAKEGRTWGGLLSVEGKPIVYWWFTMHGRRILSEFTGYDQKYRELSPGTALLWLCLEQMFAAQKWDVFDFGEGDADYKQTFSTHSQRCAEVFYFRKQPRTLSIVSLDMLLWGSRRLAKPLEDELERRGVKARLKRLLRS